MPTTSHSSTAFRPHMMNEQEIAALETAISNLALHDSGHTGTAEGPVSTLSQEQCKAETIETGHASQSAGGGGGEAHNTRMYGDMQHACPRCGHMTTEQVRRVINTITKEIKSLYAIADAITKILHIYDDGLHDPVVTFDPLGMFPVPQAVLDFYTNLAPFYHYIPHPSDHRWDSISFIGGAYVVHYEICDRNTVGRDGLYGASAA